MFSLWRIWTICRFWINWFVVSLWPNCWTFYPYFNMCICGKSLPIPGSWCLQKVRFVETLRRWYSCLQDETSCHPRPHYQCNDTSLAVHELQAWYRPLPYVPHTNILDIMWLCVVPYMWGSWTCKVSLARSVLSMIAEIHTLPCKNFMGTLLDGNFPISHVPNNYPSRCYTICFIVTRSFTCI